MLLDLPDEVLLSILDFTQPLQLLSFMRVSRKCRALGEYHTSLRLPSKERNGSAVSRYLQVLRKQSAELQRAIVYAQDILPYLDLFAPVDERLKRCYTCLSELLQAVSQGNTQHFEREVSRTMVAFDNAEIPRPDLAETKVVCYTLASQEWEKKAREARQQASIGAAKKFEAAVAQSKAAADHVGIARPHFGA